jgi:hypothetical protein
MPGLCASSKRFNDRAPQDTTKYVVIPAEVNEKDDDDCSVNLHQSATESGLGPGGREFESLRPDSVWLLKNMGFRTRTVRLGVSKNGSGLCRGYAAPE